MSRVAGYSYAVCQDGCEPRYDRPDEARNLDRWAEAHVKDTGHSTVAGVRVMGARPEVCPACAEVVCDADCPLALVMGWSTE